MPPPSSNSHIAALDGLRGLAALYVTAFHAWQWPKVNPEGALVPTATGPFDSLPELLPFLQHGDKAVPMFVVLSGFLIYRSLRTVETVGQIRAYLQHRFIRIFPLFAATVITLFAFLTIRGTPLSFTLQCHLRSSDFSAIC